MIGVPFHRQCTLLVETHLAVSGQERHRMYFVTFTIDAGGMEQRFGQWSPELQCDLTIFADRCRGQYMGMCQVRIIAENVDLADILHSRISSDSDLALPAQHPVMVLVDNDVQRLLGIVYPLVIGHVRVNIKILLFRTPTQKSGQNSKTKYFFHLRHL